MIEYIVTGIVSFYLGWLTRGIIAKIIVRQHQDTLFGALEKELDKVVHVGVKKDDNMFYVYRKDNQEFLAQGKTPSEVKNVLEKNYPGKTFILSEHELKEVDFNESL